MDPGEIHRLGVHGEEGGGTEGPDEVEGAVVRIEIIEGIDSIITGGECACMLFLWRSGGSVDAGIGAKDLLFYVLGRNCFSFFANAFFIHTPITLQLLSIYYLRGILHLPS